MATIAKYRTLFYWLALAPLAFGGVIAKADEVFQQPPVILAASEILPESQRSGPGFRVEERVSNNGSQNTYTVQSDYGELEIIGTNMLRARLQEIRATQALEKLEDSDEFKGAAKRGVEGMVEGGKALINEPVDTTKSAARGVGRWLRNVGSAVVSDDPHQDNALETAVGYDAAKRAYAVEMRVDPYTDFEPFQKHLGEVAKAATAGGMVTRVAVKVSTAGSLAGTVANVTSVAQMKEVLKLNPPSQLEAINREKLLAMGIKEYQASALLVNYNYTPVEMTVICEALQRMGDIRGREILVTVAASAPDREVASYMMYHVEMLANYIENIERADVVDVLGKPWLLTPSGTLVGIFPLDHLLWTRNVTEVVDIPAQRLEALGVKHRKLLLQGQFSPQADKALRARGWEISGNFNWKPAA